jgi:hypothetical protein
MQLKIRSVVKGAATFVPALQRFANSAAGSPVGARYFYSVWLRHLASVHEACGPFRFDSVAELGPGDALGLGLCALLSGARRYVGLDLVPFTSRPKNRVLLDTLVDLFRTRSPIPDDAEFPGVYPKLRNYAFPRHILTDNKLDLALAPERLAVMQTILLGEPGSAQGLELEYIAPWNNRTNIKAGTIDWLVSQAVLEHVDDIEGAYAAMRAWLKTDGIMSHRIDYSCHGITRDWFGHWTVSPTLWRVVRGNRAYLVNRLPHSAHIAALRRQGFDVVAEAITRTERPAPERLIRISHQQSDLSVMGAFVVARPRGNA